MGGGFLEDVPEEGQPLKMKGSVMLALAESKEQVMKEIEEDVYFKNEVWDRSKVSRASTSTGSNMSSAYAKAKVLFLDRSRSIHSKPLFASLYSLKLLGFEGGPDCRVPEAV